MRPLDGTVVLDLSTAPSGRFCARVLHDLGATVYRPSGLTPPVPDLPDEGRRAAATYALAEELYLDAGKHRVDLELEGEGLAAACRAADVIVETFKPGELARRGVDAEALTEAGAVVVSLTPFGQTGPRASWEATELTLQAYGGFLGLSGSPDREPVKVALEQMHLVSGRVAAFAALASLYARRNGGPGRQVDAAVVEVAASLPPFYIQQYTHAGAVMMRGPRVQPALDGRHLRTRDGYLCFATGGVQPFEMFSVLLADEALLDERFRTRSGRRAHAVDLDAIVERRVREYEGHDLFRRAMDLRIVAGVVQTLDDLLDCPHLKERGFFQALETPHGVIRIPGLGITSDAFAPPALAATERPATVPLRSGERPAPSGRAPAGQAPLAGVRVVAVEDYLFLPWATVQLAELGAEVIHVESRSRIANRQMGVYPHNRPGPRFWDEPSAYTSFERNKASLTLDLATPAGRDAFLRLAATADLVMENNRPGVMERLGLGYDVLARQNPRLIMMRCSGYGQSGPYRNAGAFARTIDVMSGLTHLTGYRDGQPVRANPSFMDMVSAWNNAGAAVAGLLHRERTGTGMCIDVAMYETGVSTVGTALVAHQLGVTLGRSGNCDLGMAPHGVYPTRNAERGTRNGTGDDNSALGDRWIAIAVRDDGEWTRLAAAIGEPWAADAGLRSLAGRWAARDRLDERLARWTAGQDAFDCEARLQAFGIPAAVVRDARDLVLDEHLRARGFFQWVQTPCADREFVSPHPGPPFHIEGHQSRDVASARMGEDNERVLRALGYDTAAIDGMARAGVIGDAPVLGAVEPPEPANLDRLGVSGTLRAVDEQHEAVIAAFWKETHP